MKNFVVSAARLNFVFLEMPQDGKSDCFRNMKLDKNYGK